MWKIMEDYIKSLLAQQVYELSTKKYYTYVENRKVTEEPVLNVVKSLYAQGVSSLSYIPMSDNYNAEPLVLSLLKNNNLSEVAQYALEQISPEEFKKLDVATQNSIMKHAIGDESQDKNIKLLFEKGWRLQQAPNNQDAVEIDCAMSGNLFFFETLVSYQPNINFNFQYNIANEKCTLMELIEEDIPYVQNHANAKHMENTAQFLKSYASYIQMQNDLPTHQSTQPRAKI